MAKGHRAPQMRDATPTHVVEALLTLAVLQPMLGCRRYADLLADQGPLSQSRRCRSTWSPTASAAGQLRSGPMEENSWDLGAVADAFRAYDEPGGRRAPEAVAVALLYALIPNLNLLVVALGLEQAGQWFTNRQGHGDLHSAKPLQHIEVKGHRSQINVAKCSKCDSEANQFSHMAHDEEAKITAIMPSYRVDKFTKDIAWFEDVEKWTPDGLANRIEIRTFTQVAEGIDASKMARESLIVSWPHLLLEVE